MSAPVFLCEDLQASRIVLDGAEGRHAAGSRRMAAGEAVDLVDGRGTRASCRVLSSGRDTLTLEVVGREVEPPPALRVVLVQALPKGDRGELAVELATEVGVDEVVPWVAARCVMQWKGERGDKQHARWASTAREAAKQSRRAWVPPVTALHTTAQVAARIAATTGVGTALVLHEAAGAPLSAVDLPAAGEVLLVVGPEGGIDERELEAFAAAGARTVRLGSTVLRTSTAGAAAAAVVSTRTGRW
jgi:16S rRNA (uracil1498-N3)-methyltransferase